MKKLILLAIILAPMAADAGKRTIPATQVISPIALGQQQSLCDNGHIPWAKCEEGTCGRCCILTQCGGFGLAPTQK